MVTTVDWIALAVIAVAGLNGLRLGLVAGVFSLAGIVAGAYVGAKLAPQLFSGGESAYTPLVALGGAVVLGAVLRSVAGMAGGAVRSSLLVIPPLRVLDTLGGLALGAATGLALIWVVGAVALHLPGQSELRQHVQESRILRQVNRQVPPSRLLDAISRVDLLDRIAGPQARVAPPDPALLRDAGVRRARASVLRVTGTACGLGIQGSAWAARPNLVVTNAHVVAGMRDAEIDDGEGDDRDAVVVHFDPRNDVAVLRVAGLDARPLELVDPVEGTAVAILGYPENGPFTATAGRIGQTGNVLTDDAYGRGPVSRKITTLRGLVRHGNSGGPAVDGEGRVQATIFAARIGSPSGYGVPTEIVRAALAQAGSPVSSGPCVG
ncbi:MAG TPA: MarP family serine protease [Gaiellaceae bacterium]|nr:MarP family serine protease [Gaiellaceae bacterium]